MIEIKIKAGQMQKSDQSNADEEGVQINEGHFKEWRREKSRKKKGEEVRQTSGRIHNES